MTTSQPPNCPACGHESRPLAVIAKAEVFQCKSCTMVHAKGSLNSSFANVVDTDPEYFSGTQKAYAEQCTVAQKIVPLRLAAYAERLGRPVRKLLEIGPGAGAYAKAYTDNDVEYVGIEIEDKVGEQTRRVTGLDIRIGDFVSFDRLDENYDVVFASQVFEHIQSPQAFLNRVKAVAAKGILHLDVPNHDSLVSRARKLTSKSEYGFIQPPYHMLAYTQHSLSKLLKRAGFENLEVKANHNDHAVWGQLVYGQSVLTKTIYRLGQVTGTGSLLTAIARIPAR